MAPVPPPPARAPHTAPLQRTPTNVTAPSVTATSVSASQRSSGPEPSQSPGGDGRRSFFGLALGRKPRPASTSSGSGSDSHPPTHSPTHSQHQTQAQQRLQRRPSIDAARGHAASAQSFHSAQSQSLARAPAPPSSPAQTLASHGPAPQGSRDSVDPPPSASSGGSFWWAASQSRQWHLNEDILLFRHVERHGALNWEQAVPGRSAEEARIAW